MPEVDKKVNSKFRTFAADLERQREKRQERQGKKPKKKEPAPPPEKPVEKKVEKKVERKVDKKETKKEPKPAPIKEVKFEKELKEKPVKKKGFFKKSKTPEPVRKIPHIDESKSPIPSGPTKIPAYHELKKKEEPKKEIPQIRRSVPKRKKKPIKREADLDSTIITDTRSKDFKPVKSIFTSVSDWFSNTKRKLTEKPVPKYTVAETEQREDIIKKATSKTGSIFTEENESLKEQIKRRRHREEEEEPARRDKEGGNEEKDEPARWDEEGEDDEAETTWSPYTESGYGLLEAPDDTTNVTIELRRRGPIKRKEPRPVVKKEPVVEEKPEKPPVVEKVEEKEKAPTIGEVRETPRVIREVKEEPPEIEEKKKEPPVVTEKLKIPSEDKEMKRAPVTPDDTDAKKEVEEKPAKKVKVAKKRRGPLPEPNTHLEPDPDTNFEVISVSKSIPAPQPAPPPQPAPEPVTVSAPEPVPEPAPAPVVPEPAPAPVAPETVPEPAPVAEAPARIEGEISYNEEPVTVAAEPAPVAATAAAAAPATPAPHRRGPLATHGLLSRYDTNTLTVAFLLMIFGLVAIVFTASALFGDLRDRVYNGHDAHKATSESIVHDAEVVSILLNGDNISQLPRFLRMAVASAPDGIVEMPIITPDGNDVLPSYLFDTLNFNTDPSFRQAITSARFVTVDRNDPSLVIEYIDTDTVRGGILIWEQSLAFDMQPLYTKTLDQTGEFTDSTIEGIDVRILDGKTGVSMVYGFTGSNTLLIAPDVDDFSRLLEAKQPKED